MHLLHIDASILGENSVSRQITAGVVERFRQANSTVTVRYCDLAAAPIAHLAGSDLAHMSEASALDDFLAADIVVIGAPMYNFTIPSQLKAWLDRVIVAGKTFAYSEAGVTGLAAAKRVIVVITRGGFYGANTPYAAAEHAESYLRAALGFIGITDLEFIVAEGIQVGPEHRENALTAARQSTAILRVS
jgi:FMN-dependent NADH-azoreductase